MKALISDARMLRLLEERLPEEGSITRLSPQLSAHLIEILAENPDNQPALETAFSLLPGLRQVTDIHWGQENAIQAAMDAFGLRGNAVPIALP